VRRAAACGLGRLRLETLVEPERRQVRGRALGGLLAGCTDGEWVVRYAVVVGLESLAAAMDPEPDQRQALLAALDGLEDPDREDTPVVRLRAKLAGTRCREVR
jgi:phycocyanobilin lyase beta subunit